MSLDEFGDAGGRQFGQAIDVGQNRTEQRCQRGDLNLGEQIDANSATVIALSEHHLDERCNREQIGVLTPSGEGTVDYFVKERIFMLGLDASQSEDRRLIEQALSRMPAGVTVME